ncbi:hypothetical protein G7054_g13545 [Neopestalotiopsis clavispora]|nr:hypothetical protein G7054_g13545 [Neopestalotiopsis clavispora]
MQLTSLFFSLVVASAVSAMAVPRPIDLIRRAHTTGTVITKCSKPGVLALAFDDGPYTYTSALVDKLDAAGAKGTFFFTGTLYGEQDIQVEYKPVVELKARIQSEMIKVEQAFVNIFGKKPAYMRPPNLATSSSMLSVMSQMGYAVITDDIDAGDWNHQTAQQSEQKFTQAGASGNGHIPLMHETYDSTVNTLVPWLINWAKSNNLKIVTVAECLDDAANMYQPGTFTGNGATSC